jgi:hypothetical protein
MHLNAGSFDLALANPYTNLVAGFAPPAVAPGQDATLSITDTHTQSGLLPGLWHTIPITPAGDGLFLSTQVKLLVGGR